MIDLNKILQAIVLTLILGLGNTVYSQSREMESTKATLDAVHEDVKEIKKILLNKALAK